MGDDVRVIYWKKREGLEGRQQKTQQRMEAMDQIGDFTKAYMQISSDYECGAIKNVVRPRLGH